VGTQAHPVGDDVEFHRPHCTGACQKSGQVGDVESGSTRIDEGAIGLTPRPDRRTFASLPRVAPHWVVSAALNPGTRWPLSTSRSRFCLTGTTAGVVVPSRPHCPSVEVPLSWTTKEPAPAGGAGWSLRR
jgi:hypothetical protein